MASALRPALLRQMAPTTSKRALPAFRSQLVRQSVLRTSPFLLQRATFQTTPQRAILPPLPQRIEGGVNEPAKVPETEPSHGSYHWTAERLVSAAIVPFCMAPFAAGSLNPLLDGGFIGLILIHSYIGYQSSITDYFPRWRVPRIRRLADWANVAALAVVGYGWYEFETNDVGLTAAVKRVWKA